MSLRKQEVSKDVWSLALERMDRTYDLFDHVWVSFSGGKDSTVILHAALEVAEARKQLPLDVYFWDEEVLAPETVDYLMRVRERDDIRMHWLALPVTHRNGCSTESPFWFPWAPEDKALWVRDMPDFAITDWPGFKRQAIPDFNSLMGQKDGSTVGFVLGIRADESMRRRQGVMHRTVDNWIINNSPGVALIKPIYDWRTVDVWCAPQQFGWDYNRAYDVMNMAGISPSIQRVAPPFGEQPMQSLWMWQKCWPEVWDKMVDRVPGAATAARYSKSELYGAGGRGVVQPPPGMSWQEAIALYLDRHPPNIRSFVAKRLQGFQNLHFAKTSRPIPELEPDPLTGLSWTFMLRTAMRGDLKGREDPLKFTKVGAFREDDLGTRY